jgi:uncharacterized membrane protein
MLKRTKLTLILLVFIISLVIIGSCSDNKSANESVRAINNRPNENVADNSAETQPEYAYPDVNYNGYTLNVLNVTDLWDMFVYLDKTELNGEILNDAVYNRNRRLETMFNFTLNEVTFVDDTAAVTNAARVSLMAGDNSYDIMYLSLPDVPALMLEGYFTICSIYLK